MKSRKAGKYVVFAALGAAMFAAGLVLIKLVPDAQGVLMTLPYISIGLGAGIFGGNLGIVISNNANRKNPQKAKQIEIEEKDERNIAVSSRAKAKAYDFMLFVLGAVMLAFALMNEEIYITLTLVVAYLLIVGVQIYYFNKYQKEM